MNFERESLFLCPQCRQPLPLRPPCVCGFVLRESGGIIDLLTAEEKASIKPFLEAYERIRRDEQWGGDDLDLPFHPKRHRDIWKIRQRTFRAFEAMTAAIPRGLALDIGAGNCWLSRYLDRWGFDTIAIDVNDSDADGLRAGQTAVDNGARFLRARARMERLPFASGRFTLLATSASFHYACDFRATLSEFERVLTPGGLVAIIDTPFYRSSEDGERMLAERVMEFQKKYGIAEPLARRSRYLTIQEVEKLARPLELRVHVRHVWPGFRRTYEQLWALFGRRHIAEFPLVVLQKAS